jgi:hypothetical protein
MVNPKFDLSPVIRDSLWNSKLRFTFRNWLAGRSNIDISTPTEKNAVLETILRHIDDDTIMAVAKEIQTERKLKKAEEDKANKV